MTIVDAHDRIWYSDERPDCVGIDWSDVFEHLLDHPVMAFEWHDGWQCYPAGSRRCVEHKRLSVALKKIVVRALVGWD